MEIVMVTLSVLLIVAIVVIAVLARRFKTVPVSPLVSPGPQRPVPAPPPPVQYVERVVEVCPIRYIDVPGPTQVVVERVEVPPQLNEISVREVVGNPNGGRPVEPQRLPSGRHQVADSEVDGARVGPLVVRTASVRGDTHRRQGELRRVAVLVEPIAGGLPTSALLSVVAAGNPVGDRSHILAGAACRSVVTYLGRLATDIGEAWLAGDVAALSHLLNSIGYSVGDHLVDKAKTVSPPVPLQDVSVELTCLLTELGDRDRRRHLAFGVGTGGVLVRVDGGFKDVFTATVGDAVSGAVLPDPSVSMRVMPFTSAPGDTVVLATGAACRVLISEFGGPFFFREWERPRDLVEFLWQASARMEHSGPDRSVVCLWDGGKVVAQERK